MALKYIYILYPGINGVQILLFRNIIGLILVIGFVNKGIKNAMWDSLLPGSLKLIFLKALIELIMRVSMYIAIKYFTVTTFAVFSNMAPIITVLLGGAILKEEVKNIEYFIILLGFASVTFMTFGMASNE
jgi:drug/metabolite transporter (DMT)-like permease